MSGNYPAMSQSEWERAPWNEKERPQKTFGLNVVYTIENVLDIDTDDYIEDEEGYVDTSYTDWESAYLSCHDDIVDLLEKVRKFLKEELEKVQNPKDNAERDRNHKLKYLIEECEGWEITDSYYEPND